MLEKYYNSIKKLTSFEKDDILTPTFKLYEKDAIGIYYAPHNEIVNKNAIIFIIGITPGWTQTCIAYKTAKSCINSNLSIDKIKKECKRNSRFAGSMRKNIVDMLDELKINKYLKLSSCLELFEDKDIFLHTTSVIPYPVFINGKNYTGSNPKITDSNILYSYVKTYFYKEAKMLSNALYIPLGKAVEEILEQLIKEGIISKEQCLLGFPHPSGANGHRKQQFEANKKQLLETVEKYFNHFQD